MPPRASYSDYKWLTAVWLVILCNTQIPSLALLLHKHLHLICNAAFDFASLGRVMKLIR